MGRVMTRRAFLSAAGAGDDATAETPSYSVTAPLSELTSGVVTA